MPNYSYNSLSVSGDKKNLASFKEEAKNAHSDLSLNSLFPMPKKLENTVAPDDKSNWYDWRVKNWGTKWDVDGSLTSAADYWLEYSFKSAWNPPIKWLARVSKDFPNLEFTLRYIEESDDFAGVARVYNGKVNESRFTSCETNGDSILDIFVDAARDAKDAYAKMTQSIARLLPEGR